MPSRKVAQLLVRHAQLSFGFAKALLDGPPDTTEPDKARQGRADGALLMEYQYVGLSPNVRLSTSQTVWVGCPSLHSVTRRRANSYSMGPFVPSDTVRRYHCPLPICRANVATEAAGVSGLLTVRLKRASPR